MRLQHIVRPGLAVCLLFAAQAWAGGLMLYEIGTPDTGLAAAGWAARAQDPGTVVTNPAGMTRLDGDQFMVGAQAMHVGMSFTPNANTTVSGPDGQNPVRWFPGASAFYVHSLAPDWKLGLGMYGNFGLALDNSDDWVGRYSIQDAAIMGMTLTPALAYKVNNQLSVGAGLDFMYGVLQYEAAVKNALDNVAGDGQLDINTHDWGYGTNLGVLYELHPGTRLGLDYTSAIDLNLKGTPTFTNLGPVLGNAMAALGQLDFSLTVPQTVMASFYHELDPRWALLGNVGWQNWSEFGLIGVEVDSANSVTANLHLNDTWHAALGAQHRYSDDWLLSFGAAYDSSMVDDANRVLLIPSGATWRFSAGGQHTLQKNLDLGLAYTFIWGGNLPIDQTNGVGPFSRRVAGEYKDVVTNIFSVSLRWRF